MERTLLYYPTIELPREDWLRQALLYTDKVSSILPFKNEDYFPRTVKYLSWKGEYNPVYIEDLINNNKSQYKVFEEDFLIGIEANNFFKSPKKRNKESQPFGTFRNKMTYNLIYKLEQKGLISHTTQDKIFLNDDIAIYYMSGLAKFASVLIKDQYVIPSTNIKYCSDVLFENTSKTEKAYNLIFDNCLPIPDQSVEISTIIEFKRKHINELREFRQFIKDLISDINSANDDYELNEMIVSAKEKIELEIDSLSNVLKKNKIKTIFTSLNTFLGIENPKLFDSLIGAGIVSTPINPKIGLTIAGVGVIAKIIDNRFFKTRERNEFNYLFQAKKFGIIK